MRLVWFGMLMAAALAPSRPAMAESTAALWHRSVTLDYRVRPDGTADSTETWTVRADTAAVAHITAQQSFSVIADMDDVAIAEAYTLKPNGRRIPVQPGAIMDQAATTLAAAPQFSALRSRTIVFPAVQAGDTVHYVLHRHGTASLFPGEFATTLQPGPASNMEQADISIALPPGMALNGETAGLAERPPELLPDGSTLRRWTLQSRASGQHPSGQVLLDVSSLPDYAALGRAYATRAWPKSRPGPGIHALAARLTQGIDDPREKALRLYRQVATDIRYVATFLGDGRVVPRPAEQVLAEGFGDCKDHAALLQALLLSVGIEAQPALISLRHLYTLPSAAGLGALNHVITYVPSLDLYLDSTAPYAPFGLLPASEYDKPVVLAHPEAARLARTPALPAAPLDVRTATEAQIGPDDVVSGATTTEASGPQGIALRSMAAWIEGRGPASAATVQLRQLGTPGTGGFTFDPPEQGAANYQVHARFSLNEPLLDGGEAPFPLPGGLGVFDRPGRLLLGSAPTEEGGHVCFPGREVEEVTLTLPPNAELRTIPQDLDVESGSAHYQATYTLRGPTLKITRTFTSTPTRVYCDPNEYTAMRPALAAARRDQRVQVSLIRGD